MVTDGALHCQTSVIPATAATHFPSLHIWPVVALDLSCLAKSLMGLSAVMGGLILQQHIAALTLANVRALTAH